MRPDLPSKFQCRCISVDTAVTPHDIALYGLFMVNAAGVTLTLPAPSESVCDSECLIVNHSNNNITIACSNGFPNSLDSITLAAGASILLYCARIPGASFCWASVGATPA